MKDVISSRLRPSSLNVGGGRGGGGTMSGGSPCSETVGDTEGGWVRRSRGVLEAELMLDPPPDVLGVILVELGRS
jgi:hypothetical protein